MLTARIWRLAEVNGRMTCGELSKLGIQLAHMKLLVDKLRAGLRGKR